MSPLRRRIIGALSKTRHSPREKVAPRSISARSRSSQSKRFLWIVSDFRFDWKRGTYIYIYKYWLRFALFFFCITATPVIIKERKDDGIGTNGKIGLKLVNINIKPISKQLEFIIEFSASSSFGRGIFKKKGKEKKNTTMLGNGRTRTDVAPDCRMDEQPNSFFSIILFLLFRFLHHPSLIFIRAKVIRTLSSFFRSIFFCAYTENILPALPHAGPVSSRQQKGTNGKFISNLKANHQQPANSIALLLVHTSELLRVLCLHIYGVYGESIYVYYIVSFGQRWIHQHYGNENAGKCVYSGRTGLFLVKDRHYVKGDRSRNGRRLLSCAGKWQISRDGNRSFECIAAFLSHRDWFSRRFSNQLSRDLINGINNLRFATFFSFFF